MSYFLYAEQPHWGVVRWLCSLKGSYALHFVINQQVVDEFKRNIKWQVEFGRLSASAGELILRQFDTHFINKFFHVVGQECLLSELNNHELTDLVVELGLRNEKSDFDARIYQSIINALAIYDGESRPILVTSDKKFANKIEARGYQTIRPSHHSKSEILEILASPMGKLK